MCWNASTGIQRRSPIFGNTCWQCFLMLRQRWMDTTRRQFSMICRSWQSQNNCRGSRQKLIDAGNSRSATREEEVYEHDTCSEKQNSPQGVGYTHDYCDRGNTGIWVAACRCGRNTAVFANTSGNMPAAGQSCTRDMTKGRFR